MHAMDVEVMPIAALKRYPRNARTHSRKQIRQIARSIERFGFNNPVLISDYNEIVAGHGRVEAAKLLGHVTVPTLRLSHLNPADLRAYVIADNKLALNAGWDREVLAIELEALMTTDFDVELTGFSLGEIDIVLEKAQERSAKGKAGREDELPPFADMAVTRSGDLWQLGPHRLACGDARTGAARDVLMNGERADLIFTDPPYRVPINSHLPNPGPTDHELPIGVGEDAREAFTQFLKETLGHAASASRDGAVAFIGMDWRHMAELLAAGRQVFSALTDVCVWNKTNGGKRSFYRSKHELVFVFTVGTATLANTCGRATRRCRDNVWNYAAVHALPDGRTGDLAVHSTVKPVALVADAIKDCSRAGDIVLDPFGGAGSTLIAAEKTGRGARLIEIDPLCCDRIIRRYEELTNKQAVLSETGSTFAMIAEQRAERTSANPERPSETMTGEGTTQLEASP